MHAVLERTAILALLVALATPVIGCAATRGRRGEPEKSGFLGDYTLLAESDEFPAALVYVSPNAAWSRFDTVELDTVTLWTSEEMNKLSDEEKQMLTDTLYTQLHEALDATFLMSSSPGPSTLRIRAAMTEADGASPVMRSVTTIIPQLRMLGTIVGLSADTATMVGTATVEVEILDSATNERLAAAVDRRSGTKVIFAKRAYSTWGDVEAASKYWAQRVAWQLAKHGVQRKPGVDMPEEPSKDRSF